MICSAKSDALLKLGIHGSAEARCERCHERSRRLLKRDEVIEMLNVSAENLQQLIATRQLTPIRIAGNERFDSWDIDGLIDSYRRTAMRTVMNEQQNHTAEVSSHL